MTPVESDILSPNPPLANIHIVHPNQSKPILISSIHRQQQPITHISPNAKQKRTNSQKLQRQIPMNLRLQLHLHIQIQIQP